MKWRVAFQDVQNTRLSKQHRIIVAPPPPPPQVAMAIDYLPQRDGPGLVGGVAAVVMGRRRRRGVARAERTPS